MPIQFAGILHGIGVRIAMDATQVAGAGDIPDSDRAAGPRFRSMDAGSVSVTQRIGRLRDAGPEFGEIDQGWEGEREVRDVFFV
jgi:hypothetical protein